MKHVYISGPMTGLPELNFPAFRYAATALRAMGFKVTNPVDLNPDPTADWYRCMRTDIKALCDCDGLVLLPGWEASKGAHLELHLAHRLGMRVATLDQLLDEKGLRADWDRLLLGSTETQPAPPPELVFLPTTAQLHHLDNQLAELSTYYMAERDAARQKAMASKQRGALDRQRRHQAAAAAWGAALHQLARLAAPI